MTRTPEAPSKREQGAALFITVMILVLVGLLAFASLRHSEQEYTGGARSRATKRALHAADAGVQLALSRLAEAPPNLNAFDIDLAEEANVQSRPRTAGAPQVLSQVGTGSTPEGYALNIGVGASAVNRVFVVNTTATAGGATAELEAKLGRQDVEASSY